MFHNVHSSKLDGFLPSLKQRYVGRKYDHNFNTVNIMDMDTSFTFSKRNIKHDFLVFAVETNGKGRGNSIEINNKIFCPIIEEIRKYYNIKCDIKFFDPDRFRQIPNRKIALQKAHEVYMLMNKWVKEKCDDIKLQQFTPHHFRLTREMYPGRAVCDIHPAQNVWVNRNKNTRGNYTDIILFVERFFYVKGSST